MNLSTARSALRAKEIGIRKVIGAQRKEIIAQFLSESVLITLVSLLLAVILTVSVLPFINHLSNQALSVGSLLQWPILLSLLAVPFVVGIISGIYPALFMSSFLPVKVLKGMLKVGSGNLSFRKVLVVLQFSISIILIIATTVVYRQLQYVQSKSLGFNKDFVLTTQYTRLLNKQYEAFKSDVMKNSAIKDMGRSSRIPTGRLLDDQDAKVLQGGSMQPIKVDLKFITTDYGFIPTYGVQMAAGRNFSKEFPTDTTNYIINEAAVQALGWKTPQNALDKDLAYGGIKGKVIGVVKDFHFESLHQKIIPLLFQLPGQGFYNRLSVKIDGRNVQSAISTIQTTWQKYLPETPFDFTFLDAKFNQLYQSEQEQGRLFTIFSCIAIFIACLGLFGLSAFTITQRVKEIGVRKVLGASIPQIVTELSKDFMKLVLIAALIAFPIAWYCTTNWFLIKFAFHVGIGWWVFVMAGIIALIIAFVTISFQSIKAALANPVESLRSE
jgi:putative ABC transport system permease protein